MMLHAWMLDYNIFFQSFYLFLWVWFCWVTIFFMPLCCELMNVIEAGPYYNYPIILVYLFSLQQLVIYETSASELDIIRDISRTFPSHVFFQQRHGPGQRSLYNVLKAYSVYDRDVGYVQVLFSACQLSTFLRAFVSHHIEIVFIAGHGICRRSLASLYEWRRCILVTGSPSKRSCSCSNGGNVFGKVQPSTFIISFLRTYFSFS